MKVIECILCSDKNRPDHAKLSSCDSCQRMVWVTDLQMRKKHEGYQLWCHSCIEKFGVEKASLDEEENDDDDDGSKHNWSEGIESEASKYNEIWSEIWNSFSEEDKKIEQKAFLKTISMLEQTTAELEHILPSLCMVFMMRLNPFARTDDLAICLSLSTLCEKILTSRRETLGPENLWQDWSIVGAMSIMSFVIGTKRAAKKFKPNDPDVDSYLENLQLWKREFEEDMNEL
jgi:hypothetical protein